MTESSEDTPPTNTLWSDDAIESITEDSLDRERFVTMVADRINACRPGQKSTVFGVVGAWGSGKTSLINFILEKLGQDWKVAIFSPWASDDANGLQHEFLAALASQLGGDEEKAKKAKDALKKYASVCTPLLKAIPYVGDAAAGVAAASLEMAMAGPPWHEQYKQVSETLESLGWKVLLVADDIDRLDADELLALLKVVRLLGRFPNVHYLIAYDQATVESLLKHKGLAGRSSAFMEKIVQYPFEVPPIAGVIQRKLLTGTMNAFIAKFSIPLDRLQEEHRLQEERISELIAVLAPALRTPRAQRRFREQLLAFGGMLKFNEVDWVDFVALSFLRVFYHGIYTSIPSWKNALQSGKGPIGFLDTSELSDKDWMDRIAPLVYGSDNDAVLVKQILSSLFPGISSSGVLYFREHHLALSDSNYFQRYFQLGVAEDDVEDQLIEAALSRILRDDTGDVDVVRYLDVLDGPNNQRAALAYEKSEKRRSRETGPSAPLVKFLFDRVNAHPDEEPSFDSARAVLWRWLEVEAFRALDAGQLNISDVLAELSPRDSLGLALRIIGDHRRTEKEKASALAGLAEYYRALLNDDLEGVLDSELDFNWLADVIWSLSAGNPFHEFGDRLVSNGNRDLLDRVLVAMVMVNKWWGMDGLLTRELAFNSDTLDRLFSKEAIRRISEFPFALKQWSEINTEDTSSQSKIDFARANVKAIADAQSQ